MAAVIISRDFGTQENKVCHCFHSFPIYLPWSDGTQCHGLSFLNIEFFFSFFWMLSFKPASLLFSFTFIKRLFSSCFLFAITVVSVICISEVIDISPGNLDSSLCFIQLGISCDVLCIEVKYAGWQYTTVTYPFPNLEPVCFRSRVASWPAYRFLRRQVRWSGIPISWRIFQFVVIHTVKGFGKSIMQK